MKTRLHALAGELRQDGQIARFLAMDRDLVHLAAVEYQQDRLGAQDVAHHNGRLPIITKQIIFIKINTIKLQNRIKLKITWLYKRLAWPPESI